MGLTGPFSSTSDSEVQGGRYSEALRGIYLPDSFSTTPSDNDNSNHPLHFEWLPDTP